MSICARACSKSTFFLEVVACCSDCSSIHNPDYSDYYATLGLDSGSNSCCSHTDPAVVTDSD